jgi:hypothetical protein
MYTDAIHGLVGTQTCELPLPLVITVFRPLAASKHTTEDVSGTQIYVLLLLLIRTLFVDNH